MRILTVVGARPQFVKAAVVSREIRRRSGWQEILVHTGQHYDENMSGVFFDELDIPQPDASLSVGSGSHGQQTGRMLEALEQVMLEHRPDWVLVFGDTNSTLAGALAATKLHIPLAHVEAGLRSFNRRMPEEMNRVLTDHASDLLFSPTAAAAANLRSEGIGVSKLCVSGDVMCDATLYYRDSSVAKSNLLSRLQLAPKSYILATIHRAENADDPRRLTAIVDGIEEIARSIPVVFPIHPRTEAALEKHGLRRRVQHATCVVPPIGYLDMVQLEANASHIVTDSGGVQKEAYFCRTPCVTLRDETEWTELVETGWNQLVSPAEADFKKRLVAALAKPDRKEYDATIYGSGNACRLICDRLEQESRQLAAVA
jgi:UDP-GlcNAc3NAcA epimerase